MAIHKARRENFDPNLKPPLVAGPPPKLYGQGAVPPYQHQPHGVVYKLDGDDLIQKLNRAYLRSNPPVEGTTISVDHGVDGCTCKITFRNGEIVSIEREYDPPVSRE